MNTEFDRRQQALETAFAYYDHLVEQDKSRDEAIEHTCQRFGIVRDKFVALLEDRQRHG